MLRGRRVSAKRTYVLTRPGRAARLTGRRDLRRRAEHELDDHQSGGQSDRQRRPLGVDGAVGRPDLGPVPLAKPTTTLRKRLTMSKTIPRGCRGGCTRRR
jgi:hypothetical protein